MTDPMDDPVPVQLNEMFIQSHDTLCGTEIDITMSNTWNDRPPLLTGPRGRPETPVLLKGLVRRGIPPALRCAVWLSNVIQAVHPHQEPEYWHEYRTLAKVRALDNAYDQLILQLQTSLSDNPTNGDKIDWSHTDMPTFGQDLGKAAIHNVLGSTEPGKLALKRVLLGLEQITGLEYAPLVPTIAALLLTNMSESYSFTAIREMTHHAHWYFPTHQREHKAYGCAFADVLFKLHQQTAAYLDDRGVLDDLDPIFRDFFVDVLPMDYVLRVMDIYTLEGVKVLFRFGVALLVLYRKEAAEKLVTISNSKEWWNTLKHWTHHPHFNFEYLVRKAYGLHGRLARKQLRFPPRSIIRRIIKMEEERLLDERDNDANYVEPPARPLGLVKEVELMDGERVKPVLAQSMGTRQAIAGWLPLSMRLTNMNLIYTTNFHGRSLEMFYSHVKAAKHSLLLCEVLGKESYVIGMYASQPWKPAAHVYGDGECFLFRVQPDAKCWKWSPRQESIDFTSDNATALVEQFMVATNHYISMGGNSDGSSGLRLNDDLTMGESSSAVGFHNEPLHGNDHDSVFSVGLVEVYGLVRQIDGRSV